MIMGEIIQNNIFLLIPSWQKLLEFPTLGKYLDDDRLEEWEVSFSKGSLSVGSAIDKWGIDINTLKDRTEGSEEPADLAGSVFRESPRT